MIWLIYIIALTKEVNNKLLHISPVFAAIDFISNLLLIFPPTCASMYTYVYVIHTTVILEVACQSNISQKIIKLVIYPKQLLQVPTLCIFVVLIMLSLTKQFVSKHY